jgi:hypothetical protein
MNLAEYVPNQAMDPSVAAWRRLRVIAVVI